MEVKIFQIFKHYFPGQKESLWLPPWWVYSLFLFPGSEQPLWLNQPQDGFKGVVKTLTPGKRGNVKNTAAQ